MTRARELGKLANKNTLTADNTNNFVGIGSTQPTTRLNVVGVVSATSFVGDGSNLEGVSSAGLGTAISDVETSPLNLIYFVNNDLNITATTTLDVPSTATLSDDGFRVAYTNYSNIIVDDSYDFIISDGDELVPDVLSLS
tara:strand:+ start:194 stop:613 length:420 start_codon:yes stop_codon:yes gene_type:complete